MTTTHKNLLSGETSPYLLQHAENPVAWRPWGAAAFAEAHERDVPVFLSVGYSTCHWCHVMAHESFEDDAVAAVLNEKFVCIKVDREELPDVDEQYMLATQLFTQRGGWPNSVWLTPDRRPWYAGTYYRKPQFIQLLNGLFDTWSNDRGGVNKQADQFVEAMRQASAGGVGERGPLDAGVIEKAAKWVLNIEDERYGGFGGRPKFPPHGMLRVLVADAARRPDSDDADREKAAIVRALDAMRLGGMYDHVGGGFHRYATDAKWFLPHFEKMLYDNAQLIVNYADAWKMTGDEAYRRVVDETFGWIEREMTDAGGGFYSALDADSEGEEGKCYLWTPGQVIEVLGEAEGAVFCDVYRITPDGTYYEEANPGHKPGTSIACLAGPIEDDALRERLTVMRDTLRAVRDERVQPHLDDKVLASWNGLMIEALAVAGRVFDDSRYTDAAARAAAFVLSDMRKGNGRLVRSWRDGRTTGEGYLDDYAYLLRGLIELHETTGDATWIETGVELARVMVEDFYDHAEGGFYVTTESHDALIVRSKGTGGGGNMPSPNGVAAEALLRLAKATGDRSWARPATGTLTAFSGSMSRNPHGTESLIAALPWLLDIAAITGAEAIAAAPPVTVEAFAEQGAVAPGGTLRIAVRIAVDGGYHVYSAATDADVMPTTIELTDGARCELVNVTWSEAATLRDDTLGRDVAVYDGVALAVVSVAIAAEHSEGDTTIGLRITAQPCDNRSCLSPREVEIAVPVGVYTSVSDEPARHPELFA